MGRKRHAPRLWLDQRPGRGWVILDQGKFIRTGFAESDRVEAQKALARYLGKIHQPPKHDDDPLIVDLLISYGEEHLVGTRSAKNAAYNVESLTGWWRARSRNVSKMACGIVGRVPARESTPARRVGTPVSSRLEPRPFILSS
jgi:hypothetical protein